MIFLHTDCYQVNKFMVIKVFLFVDQRHAQNMLIYCAKWFSWAGDATFLLIIHSGGQEPRSTTTKSGKLPLKGQLVKKFADGGL